MTRANDPGTAADDTPAGYRVEVTDLTVDYRDSRAINNVSATFPAGTISGLLGRNGSGKTTLMSTLAAFRRPTAGTILVDGEDPWENERIMERTCLIRESGDLLTDEKLHANLNFLSEIRPTFDMDYAVRLLDEFELSPKRQLDRLSRGQQSAFAVVVGLATRAPLTMFDEVHLGMDAPSRYAFYELMLEDYIANPRTIVLSSHLVNEIEKQLEHVVVLEKGEVVLEADADEARRQHEGGLQELVVQLGRKRRA